MRSYDFTGSRRRSKRVPVKNTDYKGLITLTLSYLTNQTVNSPAFVMPRRQPTITEDISNELLSFPLCTESIPQWGGQLQVYKRVALDDPRENERSAA